MKSTSLTVAIIFVIVLAGGLADVAMAGKKNVKGKDLYKEFCKPCHDKDSENGEYTPMTLIQDQWERFFTEKYVPAHTDLVSEQHEGKKVLDMISKEDLAKIKKFAIDHAADSEHPMTCG